MKAKYVAYTFAVTFMVIGAYKLGVGIKIASKAWLSQYLIDQAWSRTLAGENHVQPWPWADTWPVAELSVPKLNVSRVVLFGDSGRVLAFGPGLTHYVDEGLSTELTFVSGHRDTHFSFLKQIEVEDVFSFKTAQGDTQKYKVVDTQVVDENWQVPEQVAGESKLLILATCYPFDDSAAQASKRLLVFARPVKDGSQKSV